MNKSKNTFTVLDAAKELNKTPQFIREGIKNGTFEFGVCQVISGNRYSYYLNAKKFYEDFLGKEVPPQYRKEPVKTTNELARELGVVTDPSLARNISWKEMKK